MMSFSFKGNLKGFADPFKYKDSNGNWQTLFFGSNVVEAIVMSNRVALPVWESVPEFTQEQLNDYRNWKARWYDLAEVNMHIETLTDPYYYGYNGVYKFSQAIQPAHCAAEDRMDNLDRVKAEMLGFLETYANENGMKLDQNFLTRADQKAYCDTLVVDILPLVAGENQAIDLGGTYSYMNELWDHGVTCISAGWDDNSGLPRLSKCVKPRHVWRNVCLLEVRYEYYERYDVMTSASGQQFKPYWMIRLGFNTSNAAGRHMIFYIGKNVLTESDETPGWSAAYSSSSGDTMSDSIPLVMNAIGVAEYVNRSTYFPNGSFGFGDGGIATQASKDGYLPWPTRAAVAIYGIPSNPGGVTHLGDVDLSGCVDCHFLGDSYVALASNAPQDAMEPLLRIGDALKGGHRFAIGSAFAGRGVGSRANFNSTMLGSMAEEAGELATFMNRIVSPTRPDGEAGDFTYQVWQDQNTDEFYSKPYWRGLWLFVEDPVIPTVAPSVLRWVWDDANTQWLCKNKDTEIEVDSETIQSEWDKGLYPVIELSAEATTYFNTLGTYSTIEAWLASDFPSVWEYSVYNSEDLVPPGLGAASIPSLRMLPDYYLMPGIPGLERGMTTSTELLLLGTAMGNHKMQDVLSGHLAGAVGWSQLTPK